MATHDMPTKETESANQPKPPTNPRSLRIRSGVRAGLDKSLGGPSLGNKIWSDDWLAPV